MKTTPVRPIEFLPAMLFATLLLGTLAYVSTPHDFITFLKVLGVCIPLTIILTFVCEKDKRNGRKSTSDW